MTSTKLHTIGRLHQIAQPQTTQNNIWNRFESFWVVLICFEPFWMILGGFDCAQESNNKSRALRSLVSSQFKIISACDDWVAALWRKGVAVQALLTLRWGWRRFVWASFGPYCLGGDVSKGSYRRQPTDNSRIIFKDHREYVEKYDCVGGAKSYHVPAPRELSGLGI